MPSPLSSQTNSTGAATCWYTARAAAENAPRAVEWLTLASPNEQTTMLSAGTGVANSITKPGAYGGFPANADDIGRWRKNVIRYETPDVFESLTKEWTTAKPARTRRRRARTAKP